MKTKHVHQYPAKRKEFNSKGIEDAFYDSMLLYSLYHVSALGNIPEGDLLEALQKAIRVCYLAGIKSQYHFKRVYVFDDSIRTLRTDWRMSKTGLNLVIIHTPQLNDKTALWIWRLAEHV